MKEKLIQLFHHIFIWNQSFPLQENALKRDKTSQLRIIFQSVCMVVSVWVTLIIITICSLPLTLLLFHNYPDKGYMLVKILELAIVTFVNWVFVSLRIIPFSQKKTRIVLLLTVGVIYLFYFNIELIHLLPWMIFVKEELIFFVVLLGLTYLRGFRPQISCKTEGYMDFGFCNMIYHSVTFPPRDPWFAGKPINYYWYGYYIIAYLAKLIGIPIGSMYNIGVALSLSLPFIGLYTFSVFLLRIFFHL